MTDILERLRASSKVNGAYPKDIEDAIIELQQLRWFKSQIEFNLNQDKDGSYFLTEESYNDIFDK